MAFRLEDFKKTTRKSSAGGAPPALYPHQMKDKKALARLEVAIRTFDTLVGKRRGEMDAQSMVDFFGDPRIARGVVACLGEFYRYQAPHFAEVVGPAAAARLSEAGLSYPIALRAHTYVHVNDAHAGFLTEARRAACYAELGAPLGLSAHEWETLLHLDAEDHQILTRPGRVPTPADIVALYNFHALDTPLRRATRITVSGLALRAGAAADVRFLARSLGVKAVLSADGAAVTLSDLEMSSLLPRRPGRLARCLLNLIQAFPTRAMTGEADVLLGTRRFRLSLSLDSWKALGFIPAKGADDRARGSFRRRAEAADALHKGLLKRRAAGEANGWRIKRYPDPVVTAGGVLLPDFKLTCRDQPVFLLLDSEAGGDWGAPVISLQLGRKPIDAADVLARVEGAALNLFTLSDAPAPAVPRDVRALCDRAAAIGLIRTAEAQRALHLLDESPLIEWMRRADDPRVRYIPGVGLCSQELVAAITDSHQLAPEKIL